MSNRRPQSPFWDTQSADRVHQQKRIAKLERIQGLRDLLEAWEARDDADHAYILQLRAKLRSAENQLNAMKI